MTVPDAPDDLLRVCAGDAGWDADLAELPCRAAASAHYASTRLAANCPGADR